MNTTPTLPVTQNAGPRGGWSTARPDWESSRGLSTDPKVYLRRRSRRGSRNSLEGALCC